MQCSKILKYSETMSWFMPLALTLWNDCVHLLASSGWRLYRPVNHFQEAFSLMPYFAETSCAMACIFFNFKPKPWLSISIAYRTIWFSRLGGRAGGRPTWPLHARLPLRVFNMTERGMPYFLATWVMVVVGDRDPCAWPSWYSTIADSNLCM